MRIRQVLALVVGSWFVSLACAGPAPRDVDRDAGRVLDAVADLLEDVLDLDTSVADAKADDAAPAPTVTVDEVKCTGDAGTFVIIEKAYPGRTVNDLARATAVWDDPAGTIPGGFKWAKSASLLIRDGAIGMQCVVGQTVRFIVPPPL